MNEDERAFAVALHEDIETLKREIGYDPTRWRQMIASHGRIVLQFERDR
jgi:hypothetical protein